MSCGMPADSGAIFRVHELSEEVGISLKSSGALTRTVCAHRHGRPAGLPYKKRDVEQKRTVCAVGSRVWFPLQLEGRTLFFPKKMSIHSSAKSGHWGCRQGPSGESRHGYNELKRICIGVYSGNIWISPMPWRSGYCLQSPGLSKHRETPPRRVRGSTDIV